MLKNNLLVRLYGEQVKDDFSISNRYVAVTLPIKIFPQVLLKILKSQEEDDEIIYDFVDLILDQKTKKIYAQGIEINSPEWITEGTKILLPLSKGDFYYLLMKAQDYQEQNKEKSKEE